MLREKKEGGRRHEQKGIYLSAILVNGTRTMVGIIRHTHSCEAILRVGRKLYRNKKEDELKNFSDLGIRERIQALNLWFDENPQKDRDRGLGD